MWIAEAEDEIDGETHHTWRSAGLREVDEDHDFPQYRYNWQDWINGVRVKLNHRNVRVVATGDGSKTLDKDNNPADKLELYVGGTYDDYLITKTGGRVGQHWVVPDKGWVFIKGLFRRHFPSAVRVTYRYGETPIPLDIQRLATMLAAERVLESDRVNAAVPTAADDAGMKVADLLEKWAADKKRILQRRTEIWGVHR